MNELKCPLNNAGSELLTGNLRMVLHDRYCRQMYINKKDKIKLPFIDTQRITDLVLSFIKHKSILIIPRITHFS